MPSLRRHQLAHLSPAGWEAVRQGPWDAEARECLAFWARRQLPLVVTQQRAGVLDGHLALGLPAPLRWQRRRLALHAPIRGLMYFDEFPAPAAVLALLPASVRDEVSALASRLAGLGVDVRVYGSHGWQRITGLSYLRPGSDLDLRLAVPDAATADATVALLAAARLDVPRLDGELVFGDGSAVAWREWLAWRDGRTERILVKRLHGVSLEAGEAWLLEPLEC